MTIDVGAVEIVENIQRNKVMLCEVTIYIDENTYVGAALEAAQQIAAQYGSRVEQLRLDSNESSLGITISEMPITDYASFIVNLANTGIQFTAVTDVTSPPPENPYLIIHYKNASASAMKRIQVLISWLEKNSPNALIGSVTDLPNDRPEDGLQIEFQGASDE